VAGKLNVFTFVRFSSSLVADLNYSRSPALAYLISCA